MEVFVFVQSSTVPTLDDQFHHVGSRVGALKGAWRIPSVRAKGSAAGKLFIGTGRGFSGRVPRRDRFNGVTGVHHWDVTGVDLTEQRTDR